MTTQDPPPHGIDITRPNVARIYDYLLGGKDNFSADREAAKQLGVRYVLEGSVRKSANRVRITGQLIDAFTGRKKSRSRCKSSPRR